MVVHQIPKPFMETHIARPQRRHYFDEFARDLELKIVNPELRPLPEVSTYDADYEPFDKGITGMPKIIRRARRTFDPHVPPMNDLATLNRHIKIQNSGAAMPKIKDADNLLYSSTYQLGYNEKKNQLKFSKFHYLDKLLGQKPFHNQTPQSLYQESYESQPSFDKSALGNPGKEHVMTKLLYQVLTPDLTARDLFHGSGSLKKGTSYKFDYQNSNRFVPSTVKELPKSIPVKVDRAIKFRRWAEQ